MKKNSTNKQTKVTDDRLFNDYENDDDDNTHEKKKLKIKMKMKTDFIRKIVNQWPVTNKNDVINIFRMWSLKRWWLPHINIVINEFPLANERGRMKEWR